MSWLIASGTRRHLDDLLKQAEVAAGMVVPRHFTGPDLPDVPIEFDYMRCPRCISHGSSRPGARPGAALTQ